MESIGLFKAVADTSADVAEMKVILEKILEVQEKQQRSLETIAACLENVAAAFGTDWAGRGVLLTNVVNLADFPR